MRIIDVITSRLLQIFRKISGKFSETLYLRKIYNPIRHRRVAVRFYVVLHLYHGIDTDLHVDCNGIAIE